MIPLRLTLHNFLSYPSADLDLAGIHTACICGPNGAGKSALLEALTWGIWGQSRASNDQDVIRKGSTSARVSITYKSHGQCYRVIRSRSSSGTTQLEWQIQHDQTWRSLTQKGVKATQLAIQNQLKLDYETFINSAYLRQGKADEFTLKRAGERKQILAEILKLSQYDVLADRCREQARVYKTQTDYLQGQLDQLEQQRAQQKHLDIEIEQLQTSRHHLETQLQQTQSHLETLKAQVHERSRLGDRHHSIATHLKIISHNVQMTEAQWRQHRQQLQQIDQLLNQAEQIQAGCAHYHQLLAQDQHLTQTFDHYQALTQRQHHLKSEHLRRQEEHQTHLTQITQQLHQLQIQHQADQALVDDQARIQAALANYQTARQALQEHDHRAAAAAPLLAQRQHYLQDQQHQLTQLQARRNLLQQQITAAVEAAQPVDLKQAIGILELDLATLQDQRHYREQLQNTLQQRRLFVEQLQERQRFLQQQWQKIDQHQQLLKHTDSQTCPLCEQALDPHLKTHVLERQSIEQEELETELFVIREQLAVTDREIEVLAQEKKDLDTTLKYFDQHQREQGRLEQQLEAQLQSQTTLAAWQAECEQLHQDMARLARYLDPDRQDPQTQETHESGDPRDPWAQLQQALAEIGYDEREHALCLKEVERWRWAEYRWHECQKAMARQKVTQQQIQQLEHEKANVERTYQERHQQEIGDPLQTLATQLHHLNYNPTDHHHLRAQLTEAQTWLNHWHDLQQALHHHADLQDQTQKLATTLQNQRQHWAVTHQQLEAIQTQLNGIPAPLELHDLDQELVQLRGHLDATLSGLGALQERRQSLAQIQDQQQQLSQAHTESRHQHQVYQELATAYGPNGIPAMIIENVLPELEAEANRILGRLSHHQLHLHFATQRAGRRQDKMIDTLDILIADPRGTRPYETYSGGEAFRINFAIRLALSHLLARRAGSRLQTLLIDEGFGTQDQAGREQLIRAINTVAQDFACILVITHIPSLQDAFSQRIDVERTSQGSRICRLG